MYTIRLSDLVLADLEIIRQYGIDYFGYNQADQYELEIKNELLSIQKMPTIGHHSAYLPSEYRIRTLKSHYIIYMINEKSKEVYIVRIVHKKMDLGKIES